LTTSLGTKSTSMVLPRPGARRGAAVRGLGPARRASTGCFPADLPVVTLPPLRDRAAGVDLDATGGETALARLLAHDVSDLLRLLALACTVAESDS
jgi:hypothetical protein